MIRTNLLELNNKNPAPFVNDKIINIDDYIESNGYVTNTASSRIEDVPFDRIIGHTQIYGTLKWGDALNGGGLKRADRTLRDLENNPDYYLSPSDDGYSGVSFVKIGDDYFIQGGKHRVVIGRFFAHFNPDHFGTNPSFKNVSVETREIDTEWMEIKSDLAVLAKAYPEHHFLPEYTHDGKAAGLTVFNSSFAKTEMFSREQIKTVINEFKNPSLIKKFKGGRIYILIPFDKCLKYRLKPIVA